ncbi:hypothetical protein [Streptomyces bauhiniae]|nr:hypothetical protein [Streptomyces bauhiniae]
MPGVPALALDRRNDILAWNTPGHALLAPPTSPPLPRTPPPPAPT